jgi:hypothetical protein
MFTYQRDFSISLLEKLNSWDMPNRTITCQGTMDYGQQLTPVESSTLSGKIINQVPSDWIAVRSSYYHVCGLRANGLLNCWGALILIFCIRLFFALDLKIRLFLFQVKMMTDNAMFLSLQEAVQLSDGLTCLLEEGTLAQSAKIITLSAGDPMMKDSATQNAQAFGSVFLQGIDTHVLLLLTDPSNAGAQMKWDNVTCLWKLTILGFKFRFPILQMCRFDFSYF